MIEEIRVFGVYLPSALVWAVAAAVVAHLLRNLVQRSGLQRLLWHPGLLELALFASLWWGLTQLADDTFPRWLVS